MTSLTRYLPAGTGEVAVGVADRGWVAPLGGSVAELLRLSAAELRERCADPGGPVVPMAEITLLPPIDGRMEVWAAGVTYRQSRAARVTESRAADLYRWASGTCLVPELPFTLAEGDQVEIEIDEIGTLRTQVGRGVEAMAWLVDAVTDPRRRSAGRSPDG